MQPHGKVYTEIEGCSLVMTSDLVSASSRLDYEYDQVYRGPLNHIHNI